MSREFKRNVNGDIIGCRDCGSKKEFKRCSSCSVGKFRCYARSAANGAGRASYVGITHYESSEPKPPTFRRE